MYINDQEMLHIMEHMIDNPYMGLFILMPTARFFWLMKPLQILLALNAMI